MKIAKALGDARKKSVVGRMRSIRGMVVVLALLLLGQCVALGIGANGVLAANDGTYTIYQLYDGWV
ncbi:MAG: hypothetical protein MUO24_04740 [Desulfobacterales bacterium]|nr:hypothetical protein [Desulfobacterales bacterium]